MTYITVVYCIRVPSELWARDRYAKMAATEDKLTINEEYAKRYEQKKRAEELSKREQVNLRIIPFPSMFLSKTS